MCFWFVLFQFVRFCWCSIFIIHTLETCLYINLHCCLYGCLCRMYKWVCSFDNGWTHITIGFFSHTNKVNKKLILVSNLQITVKLNQEIYIVRFIFYEMKQCESSYICLQTISSYMFNLYFIKLLFDHICLYITLAKSHLSCSCWWNIYK